MNATTHETTTIQSEPQSEPRSEPQSEPQGSAADAVLDVALAWIDAGLGIAKTSLASSARAIERTADALDALRARLRA